MNAFAASKVKTAVGTNLGRLTKRKLWREHSLIDLIVFWKMHEGTIFSYLFILVQSRVNFCLSATVAMRNPYYWDDFCQWGTLGCNADGHHIQCRFCDKAHCQFFMLLGLLWQSDIFHLHKLIEKSHITTSPCQFLSMKDMKVTRGF